HTRCLGRVGKVLTRFQLGRDLVANFGGLEGQLFLGTLVLDLGLETGLRLFEGERASGDDFRELKHVVPVIRRDRVAVRLFLGEAESRLGCLWGRTELFRRRAAGELW